MNRKHLKALKEWEKKVSSYNLALSTMGFDRQTIAPKKGAEFFASSYAYLAGEAYSIETDPSIYEMLKEMKEEEYPYDVQRKIQLYLKRFDLLHAIPKKEYVAFQELCNKSEIAWEEAKTKKQYKIFEPYLIELIETTKRFCTYRNPKEKPYNILLADYEEGMNIKKYDAFFKAIKKEIVPLVKKIAKKQNEVDDSIIHQPFDVKDQEVVMGLLQKYLRFDPSWGYMSVSMHPFTSGFSKNDVRITTSFDPNSLDSMFSIIHEIGHATFEHQVDKKYEGTSIAYSITSGIHESQSRLFENNLGRNSSFWDSLYPTLQTIFPEQLQQVTQEQFVRAINASKPSLIRTEADELTYPIHILLRYELEKGIFDGTISTKGLNKTWNTMMEKYLGVKVHNDAEGILQDIHWSDASFGYFPAYALGSAYAAQFMHTMRQELDVDALLSQNKMQVIENWLQKKIHSTAALYTPDEILQRVTNEPFNPNYYIKYLTEKYKKLYNI